MKGEPIFLQIEMGRRNGEEAILHRCQRNKKITVNDHVAGKHRIYNRSR